MKTRLDFDAALKEFLSENYSDWRVYFQPPTNVKMEYPCVRYTKEAPKGLRADDSLYLKFRKYSVTAIHRNPDCNIGEELMEYFEHCSYENRYVTDNLYHEVLTIYY